MNLHALIDNISSSPVYSHIVSPIIELPKSIYFLTKQQHLSGQVLYIMDSDKGFDILAGCTVSNFATVICSGTEKPEEAFWDTKKINIICYKVALPELYNMVNDSFIQLEQAFDKVSDKDERFQHILTQILDAKTIEENALIQLTKTFPNPIQNFYCVITIDFFLSRNRNIPYQELIDYLRTIIPNANMAQYQNSIVILFPYERRTFAPKVPVDKFTPILEKYDGYIGISYGSTDIYSIRTLYLLANNTIRLAQGLSDDSKQRIFFFDDYLLDNLVNFASSFFQKLMNNDEIVYLAHPGITYLMRYDKEYNSDLCQVLKQYVLNGRSISRTAAEMYMHRNTVQRKINKIAEIVGEEVLKDGALQTKLLISAYIVEHYKRFCNRELRLTTPLPEIPFNS